MALWVGVVNMEHGTLFGLISGEIVETDGFINISRVVINVQLDSCPASKKENIDLQ